MDWQAADAEGGFSVSLRPGLHWLVAAGVGHEPFEVPVYGEEEQGVSVAVRLGRGRRTDLSMARVVVAGRKRSIALRPGSDGRLYANVASDAPRLRYRFLGATRGACAQSAAGADAEAFSVAPDGTYWAIADAVGGRAELVLDPGLLSPERIAARVEVTPSDGAAAAVLAVWEVVQEEMSSFEASLRTAADTGGVRDVREAAAAFDWGARREVMVERASAWPESHPGHRAARVAAFAYGPAARDGSEATRGLAEAVLRDVGEDDELWGLFPGARERAEAAAAGVQTAPAASFFPMQDGNIGVGEAPRSEQVGAELPAFEVVGLADERTYTPADLHGRAHLVELWASWCAPCQERLSVAYELLERHDALERLVPFTIVVDDDEDAVALYRRESERLPGIHTRARPGGAQGVLATFGNPTLPLSFLVDESGTVLEVNPTPEHIEAYLRGEPMVAGDAGGMNERAAIEIEVLGALAEALR